MEAINAMSELVENVPDAARAYFQVAWEGEKLVWWWPRLTLVASGDSDLKQRRARLENGSLFG